MSLLTLKVLTVDALPPQAPLAVSFGPEGGTLGRDENSTMVLPDRHRRVSRLHATVRVVDGAATLTNASTSLPILIGDRQLDYGDSVALTDGMQIEIGPYLLLAEYPALQAARRVESRPLPDNVLAAAPTSPTDVGAATRTPAGSAAFEAVAGQAPPPSLASVPPAAILPETYDPLLPASTPTNTLLSPLGSQAAAPIEDPFADLLQGLGSSQPAGSVSSPVAPAPGQGLPVDPLAWLGEAPSPSAAAPVPVSPAPSVPSGGLIPEDFNPFDLPSESTRNAFDPLASLVAPPSPAAAALDGGELPPVESLFPPAAPAPRDPLLDAFGSPQMAPAPVADGTLASLTRMEPAIDPLALLTGSQPEQPSAPVADHTPEFAAAFVPPRALGSDPLLGLGGAQPSPGGIPGDPFADWLGGAASPTVATNLSASLQSAAPSRAPVVQPSAPPHSPPVPASEHAPHAAAVMAPVSGDALLNAFLEGAQLPPSALPQGLTPEQMRIIGSLLRSAVGGAIDMLSARAATKRELQASVTIIAVEANNPLKFLPNADVALQQLLGKKMPGFMRADVAMRDAFNDLRAHEIGVIAGTRAALAEVLSKFDPAQLEQRLTRGSVLESLLPAARKARLWEQYVALYDAVRREAEDDFQSMFGRAFVEAYEREVGASKGGMSR